MQSFRIEQPSPGAPRSNTSSIQSVTMPSNNNPTLSTSSQGGSGEDLPPSHLADIGQMNSDFVVYNNSQVMCSLHSPHQQEQQVVWPGNTFDMHNNSQVMCPSHLSHQQEQVVWPGNTFDMHNNSQVICPSYSPHQQEQQVTWPGNTFDMHNNSQVMLPSHLLNQPTQEVGNIFNMQNNSQILSTSLGVPDGTESPMVSTIGTQNPRSQILSNSLHTATLLSQQQSFRDQSFAPILATWALLI